MAKRSKNLALYVGRFHRRVQVSARLANSYLTPQEALDMADALRAAALSAREDAVPWPVGWYVDELETKQ